MGADDWRGAKALLVEELTEQRRQGQSGTFQKVTLLRSCRRTGGFWGEGYALQMARFVRLLGKDSEEQLELIGYRGQQELVHRDEMVLGDKVPIGDGDQDYASAGLLSISVNHLEFWVNCTRPKR